MILHTCEQGSHEWNMLRCGRPTASVFDKIVTPAKAELSKSSRELRCKLAAERILGYPIEGITTAAMEAGREGEPKAAAWYEFDRGIQTQVVGICFTDDGRIGASPDRLVGDEGLLEIKCPTAPVHVSYLLDPGTGVAKDYKPQIQGQLWITGRAWLDSLSFCPPFPSVIWRVERDEEYIERLATAVTQFADELDATVARLVELGAEIAEPEVPMSREESFAAARERYMQATEGWRATW